MIDNNSPEEKLLDIIKRGSGHASKGPVPKRAKTFPAGFFRKSFFAALRIKPLFQVLINAGFVVSLVFFIVNLILSLSPPSARLKPLELQEQDLDLESNPPEPAPVEDVVAAIGKKDIFNSAAFRRDPNADISVDGVKNLGLVGIISEEPKQAIVKDKRSGEIYYLKAGESLGEFKVVEILEGKIVVEYRQERFEIHL